MRTQQPSPTNFEIQAFHFYSYLVENVAMTQINAHSLSFKYLQILRELSAFQNWPVWPVQFYQKITKKHP